MKEAEPQDPMELVGVALPQGDADYMAECLVEEYMFLGWNEKQLMSLFSHPMFQATHRIYHNKGDQGEEYVRSLIHRVQEKWSQGWTQEGESHA